MGNKLISIKKASEMLGVTPLTLRNWDKNGKLKAMRHPLNNYRVYKVEDIERLIGDRYLIQVLDIEDETESGILLPSDELSRAYEVGRVLVVGNGDRLDTETQKEMYWVKGDVIAFERMSGRKIMIAGLLFRIVNQAHTYFRFSPDVVREAEAEIEGGAN